MYKSIAVLEREENQQDDELNAAFLFSCTSNALLARIVSGELDANAIARATLASRGLNEHGEWIGFAAAEKFHGKVAV